jgi:hypothetical protein
MSFRKKQLIQERNIFLEKKYLSEQTTTPSPQPVTPTNKTQVTKLDDKQVKLLPDCSTNPDSSVKKESGYTTTDKVVYVTTDGKSFCTTPLEEK